MKFDRRTVLIGGGAGVGLIVAFALWPRRLRSDLVTGKNEQAFGNFIKIGRDGRVTVAVAQTETGQGIWTGLPQIVAASSPTSSVPLGIRLRSSRRR